MIPRGLQQMAWHFLLGCPLATGRARHWFGQTQSDPRRCVGTCLPTDQDGGWICRNKEKGGGQKKQRLRVSQHQEGVPVQSVVCEDSAWGPASSVRLWEQTSGDRMRKRSRSPLPSQVWTIRAFLLGPSDHNRRAAWARGLLLSEEF